MWKARAVFNAAIAEGFIRMAFQEVVYLTWVVQKVAEHHSCSGLWLVRRYDYAVGMMY